MIKVGRTKRYIIWKFAIPDEDGLIPVWDKIEKRWVRIPISELDKCTFVTHIKKYLAKELGVKPSEVELPYREYPENYKMALSRVST